MANVKRDAKYYVRLPGHELYVQSDGAVDMTFTKFSDNALEFAKPRAIELAKKYSFEAIERITTTTTQIETNILRTEAM